MSIGIYSYHIDIVYNYLTIVLGYKVNRFAFGLTEALGRINYLTKEILINCSEAKEALFVITHEAGHALAALIIGQNIEEKINCRKTREMYAYVFGRRIIKLLKLPITDEQWMIYHEQEILEYHNLIRWKNSK